MPETQKQWIKRLKSEGWTQGRGGKHQVKMSKPGHRPITLPEHKAMPTQRASKASFVSKQGFRF